jgi:hypothetical protein
MKPLFFVKDVKDVTLFENSVILSKGMILNFVVE